MRRKPNTLVPLEVSILEAAIELRESGVGEFHGYALSKQIRAKEDARLLVAYGTLYRALNRLEQAGLLESFWEDPDVAARANRPRRRLYRLTGAPEVAIAKARAAGKTHRKAKKLTEKLPAS